MAAAVGSSLEARLSALEVALLGVSSSSEESTQNDVSFNQRLKRRQRRYSMDPNLNKKSIYEDYMPVV
jgi:hypothetical protein